MRYYYTGRQAEIMRLVRDETQKNGTSPSASEIGRVLKIAGETVFEHLRRLELLGAVRKVKIPGGRVVIEILDPDFMPKLQRDEVVHNLVAMLAQATGRTQDEVLSEARGVEAVTA